MNFDRELSRALRRKPAPPGFSGRVMDRVRRESSPRATSIPRHVTRAGLLAATILIAIVTGAVIRREVVETRMRTEGEWAKAQVMFAMRIASDKANLAKDNVRMISETSVDDSSTESEVSE